MIRDIIKHKLDYAVLLVISMLYITLFLLNQNNAQLLLVFTIAFGVTYTIWGWFHHFHTRSLNRHVMLEYILVSLLAVILVATLLI
jgi:hypothetical protein